MTFRDWVISSQTSTERGATVLKSLWSLEKKNIRCFANNEGHELTVEIYVQTRDTVLP